MSAPQDRRRRLLAALYAKFGESAVWTPAAGGADTPVTVRPHTGDVEIDFGQSKTIAPQNMLRVRSDDLTPATKDTVVIGEGAEARTVKVIGKPRLAHQGLEWVCEIA